MLFIEEKKSTTKQKTKKTFGICYKPGGKATTQKKNNFGKKV